VWGGFCLVGARGNTFLFLILAINIDLMESTSGRRECNIVFFFFS
jgi:hypothetical protein